MNIQSLSIVVPTGNCWNNCPFCVSRINPVNDVFQEMYKNCKLKEEEFHKRYLARMAFARDNGCNTMMITGTAEPQQNVDFMLNIFKWNEELSSPFRIIELQTTGSGLVDKDMAFLAHKGLTTISFSICSFNDEKNNEIIGTPKNKQINLLELTEAAVNAGLNVRYSLNLNNSFNYYEPSMFFEKAKRFGAHQLTFRVLYTNGENSQSAWIKGNNYLRYKLNELTEYIQKNGTKLYPLGYGATVYSINGISTVIDDDCMAQQPTENFKYLILRDNGHLYCRWNDLGSLIF